MNLPTKTLLSIGFLWVCLPLSLLSQSVYYSRNATSGGDWNLTSSWTFVSDGSGGPTATVPGRADSVVILAGHTIYVNNVNDNGSPGIDATSLGLANVGPFVGDDANAFYRTGTMMVYGTLDVDEVFLHGGITKVYSGGTLRTTAGRDLINTHYLEVFSGGNLSIDDDFILTGTSETILNNNSTGSDDIYLDHTDALLCGNGSLSIADDIQVINGAVAADQICSGFTISCSDLNCCETNPPAGCSGGVFGGDSTFVLPVQLLSAKVVSSPQQSIHLAWEVATETNHWFYAVQVWNHERWEELGKVFSRTEHSAKKRSYTFPLDDVSYEARSVRLTQTDIDGKTTVLSTLPLPSREKAFEGIRLFPNPAQSTVTVQAAGPFEVELYADKGVLLYAESFSKTEAILPLYSYPNGSYFMVVKQFEQIIVKRLLIRR